MDYTPGRRHDGPPEKPNRNPQHRKEAAAQKRHWGRKVRHGRRVGTVAVVELDLATAEAFWAEAVWAWRDEQCNWATVVGYAQLSQRLARELAKARGERFWYPAAEDWRLYA